jgi:hypothetical protein
MTPSPSPSREPAPRRRTIGRGPPSAGGRPVTAGRVRLDSIALLRPGFAQRTPASEESLSPWRILLGRHAIQEGRIDWSDLPPCEPSRGIERFALHDDDVLLTTRTTNVRAVVARSVPPHTIASAQFAVLRLVGDRVDARYLAWFLNRDDARARLRTLFKGSTIPFLPVADLAGFEILLPPIEYQRALARVNELRGRERELRLKLDHAFEVLMEAASQRHSNTKRP